MNVRKPIDYGAMFAALDALMAAELQQMELYYKLAGWSAPGRRKVPLSPLRNICALPTLTPPASPPGISVGCGTFTAPMRIRRKCWQGS